MLVAVFLWKGDDLQRILGWGASKSIDKEFSASGPAVKVIAQSVDITENTRLFRAIGTGHAQVSAEIYPSVSEEVTGVFFKAGDSVKKGDVLVQLDDREEVLSVKLAEVRLKDAQALLDRYNLAVKAGGVPQSEVDAAQADYDAAEVDLELARLAVEDRQIKAPFDGIVGIPDIDPGDRVSPETLITGLDARSVLYVDFDVPEALAGALNTGDSDRSTITATTPAYLSLEFSGNLTAQESRIDPLTRTIRARAEIDNADDLLRPGMSFEIRWNIAGQSYATVPEIALQWGREGSFIWLIKDNVARKTPGKVIARKAGQVLLEGEIQQGDQVVIEGVQRLRPDQSVEIMGQDNP